MQERRERLDRVRGKLFIKTRHVEEEQRKKWFGMPPTPMPEGNWRPSQISF